MPEKVFISYRHTDGPWVWGRLQPVLEAGGLEVLIDIERFRAGVELFQQMDDLQDQADCQLLVVSEPYLKSPSCKHEMHRAIESDPDFQSGKVILVRIDDAKWPRKLTQPNPLYAFMKDDSQPNAWDALLRGLEIDLGVSPAEWLRARDEIVQLMERGLSVNLVCEPDAAWRALLQHLQTAEHPQTLLPDLRIVDLESAKTASRRGLLQQSVKHCGYAGSLPQPPEDLVAFGSSSTKPPNATKSSGGCGSDPA